jgi:Isopropylmalate/homocitrate/citramalate synthases
MFRESIKVLDCSIRDGGLVNNHKFSFEFVQKVYRALAAAGVDYMEAGYKNSDDMFSREEYGPWKFCDDDLLWKMKEGVENGPKVSVMADIVNSEMKRVEGFGLQAAVFGAKAGNPFIKDCMDWYEKNNFVFDNSKKKQMVAPDIYAAIAQKYGFKYVCGFQQLKSNMVIMPADFFPNHLHKTNNAYAVHLCDNSWSDLHRYSKKKSGNIFSKFLYSIRGSA